MGSVLELSVYFGDASCREVLHKNGAHKACAAAINLDSSGANFRTVRLSASISLMSRHLFALMVLIMDLKRGEGWGIHLISMAFKLVMNDPNSILNSLTLEVKEIGPGGTEVTKMVHALTEKMKYALVKNIRRRITPQPLIA